MKFLTIFLVYSIIWRGKIPCSSDPLIFSPCDMLENTTTRITVHSNYTSVWSQSFVACLHLQPHCVIRWQTRVYTDACHFPKPTMYRILRECRMFVNGRLRGQEFHCVTSSSQNVLGNCRTVIGHYITFLYIEPLYFRSILIRRREPVFIFVRATNWMRHFERHRPPTG